MTGIRSSVQRLGFYVAPGKYREHPVLYVMSKQGTMKVAIFSNEEKALLFLDTLAALFEDPKSNWDLIGPCGNWRTYDSENIN